MLRGKISQDILHLTGRNVTFADPSFDATSARGFVRYSGTGFELKSRLRFLQVIAFLSLDVRLDEEQAARDQGEDAADDAQGEGPAEIIVRVAGHPAVGVAEAGEYDDGQGTAESAS